MRNFPQQKQEYMTWNYCRRISVQNLIRLLIEAAFYFFFFKKRSCVGTFVENRLQVDWNGVNPSTILQEIAPQCDFLLQLTSQYCVEANLFCIHVLLVA